MPSRPLCGWCGMKGVCSQEPQPSTPTLIAFSPRASSEQCLLLRLCSALLRTSYTESARYIHIGLPWWLPSKESVCNAWDSGSTLGLGGSAGEGKGNPLQYFLPGKSHGQRSLVGYSSWGHKSWTRLIDCTTTHTEWAAHSSLVGILVHCSPPWTPKLVSVSFHTTSPDLLQTLSPKFFLILP